MEIVKLSMPVEKAAAEHKQWCDLLKTKKEQYIVDMKNAMYQMSKGNELIDLYRTFAEVQVQDDLPRIAIVRADAEMAYFEKRRHGEGCFWHKPFSRDGRVGKIALPSGTFKFEKEPPERLSWSEHDRYRFKTVPPLIPESIRPPHGLHNYYILWEVERGGWQRYPVPPRDPILLKRITRNLFVPLAQWDMTPLEQAILSGITGPIE